MMQVSQTRYEQFVFGLSIVALVACMFVPLVAIAFYSTSVEFTNTNAEVTVGIAVLFRATARRLLRASFQNILRTTFGTVSRAFARTATRRFLRIFAHSFFGAMAKRVAEERSEDVEEIPYSPMSSFVALAVGFLGLSLSFWGVLLLADADGPAAGRFSVLPTLTLCLLAGLPIVVYGFVTYLAAKLFGVEVRFETSFDGLLIQGYFTGAGSFLPMTTDITYSGASKAKANLACTAVLSLLIIHWTLDAVAQMTGLPGIEFASAMFIVYAFVYSFPISPLEGYDIWRNSKLDWIALFVPTLFSFLQLFPQDLTGLL